MTITFETINILLLFVPGLVATRIIDAITQRREQDEWGKVVEALIFSFIIYALVNLFTKWQPIIEAVKAGETAEYKFAKDYSFLGVIAVFMLLVPLVVGTILHHDLHMKILRRLRITDKTSRDTTWQDVFVEQKRFVVIHLKDERRIYGWPMYYSDDPQEGFIYLYQPSWIDNKQNKLIECNTHGMLIQFDKIDFIEFIKDESGENFNNK